MSEGKKSFVSVPCCICEEIRTGIFPIEYYQSYPVMSRVCYESEHFIVFPSVSPLVPGHILLFPKKHFTCLMSLPRSIKKQFVDIVRKLYQHAQNHFGTTFVFEHGVVNNESTGCGINHAHLHFVPDVHHIAEKVDKKIIKEYPPDMSGGFVDLLFNTNNKTSYLLFGKDLANMYLSFSKNIPSQYVRRLISKRRGIDNWDWKELYGWQDFHATYESFYDFPNELQ